MPLLVSAILLFYVGVAFAYYFVFPVMFQFFAHTTPKGVSMMTDINNYLDFVLTMFFCFGLAFEVPVAVVLLVVMGLVRVESLAKNRGYVLIGIFILAALLTPAGRHLAVLARPAHVPAVRGRHPHGAPAGAPPGSGGSGRHRRRLKPFQRRGARCACQVNWVRLPGYGRSA